MKFMKISIFKFVLLIFSQILYKVMQIILASDAWQQKPLDDKQD